jgi:hypothetical protein
VGQTQNLFAGKEKAGEWPKIKFSVMSGKKQKAYKYVQLNVVSFSSATREKSHVP